MSVSVWLVGLAVAVQVPPPQSAAAESAQLRRDRQAIRENEDSELKALADRLNTAGRGAEAMTVLDRVEPPPPVEGPVRFLPLPEVVPNRSRTRGMASIPAEKAAAPEPDELKAIRSSAARSLYQLAVRALSGDTKYYALADSCLRAALDRDPDHPEVRRLLGYMAHDGGWATPFAVQQLKAGKVRHPTYGWVDATWVPHLEQGELPAPGASGQKLMRWLPGAEADALRNTIERAWRIETEHFLILTDVPLSEAIAFGRMLESFHDLFFSLLADVIADDLPLVRHFRDKSKAFPRSPLLHTIYYFATKEEFVAYLQQRKGADVAGSLGYYDPPPPQGKLRRAPAYFFRDKGGQLDVTATLFHEVSHQLLFESTSVGTSAYKKNYGNFWVFEGLGTYFETVASRPDGSFEVGGFVGPRIAVAQDHLLGRGEFVPVEQLVRLGQNGFINPEKVYLHYSEAMALTVFLMDGHGRQYREDFLDYVRDAHRGRLKGDNGHALEDRLGVPYKALDAEFLAELKPRNAPFPLPHPQVERPGGGR